MVTKPSAKTLDHDPEPLEASQLHLESQVPSDASHEGLFILMS